MAEWGSHDDVGAAVAIDIARAGDAVAAPFVVIDAGKRVQQRAVGAGVDAGRAVAFEPDECQRNANDDVVHAVAVDIAGVGDGPAEVGADFVAFNTAYLSASRAGIDLHQPDEPGEGTADGVVRHPIAVDVAQAGDRQAQQGALGFTDVVSKVRDGGEARTGKDHCHHSRGAQEQCPSNGKKNVHGEPPWKRVRNAEPVENSTVRRA